MIKIIIPVLPCVHPTTITVKFAKQCPLISPRYYVFYNTIYTKPISCHSDAATDYKDIEMHFLGSVRDKLDQTNAGKLGPDCDLNLFPHGLKALFFKV